MNGPGRVGRDVSLAVSGLGTVPRAGMSIGGGESIGGRTGCVEESMIV